MTKMYKLVDQNMQSHNGMKWEIGKWNKATGEGTKMCTNQVLHCYATPEQALLFNPLHARYNNPILLEIECSKIVNTDGLKFACKEQRPIKIVKLPTITTTQKVAISIKIALLHCTLPVFVKWASAWLSGEDRTMDAACAARDAAEAAAPAACAAACAAESVSWSAACAAEAAAWAAAESVSWSAAWNLSVQEIIKWVLENIE